MSTEPQTETIELADVGPVERLTIHYQPGVTELLGQNDIGKTEALQAAGRLLGSDQRLSVRDGVEGHGHVEGLGVRITVGPSTRRTGECEAYNLEGELNIGDLVEPPLKDEAAADRVRIKAWLRLTGVKGDPTLFYELVGSPSALDLIAPPEALLLTDLVDQAAVIKRAIEAAKRKARDQATHEDGHAQVCREAADAVDTAAPSDATALQDALEAAIEAHAATKNQRATADQLTATEAVAREALDRERAAYTGPKLDAAIELADRFGQQVDAAREAEEIAWNTYETAKQRRETLQQQHEKACMNRDAALSHENALIGWQESIDAAANVTTPTDTEILDAATRVAVSRRAVETGALVRHAEKQATEADHHKENAALHRAQAHGFERAAAGIDGILSDAVRSDVVTVKDGRLVTRKDGREIYFGHRSRGWRTKAAIDVAVDRLREMGATASAMLLLPQQLWEGLDPDNRKATHKHACRLGVMVLTARAERGELRAEPFGEGAGDAR